MRSGHRRRTVVGLMLTAATAGACDRAPSSADLLLLNARVYTLDWAQPAGDGTPAADAPYGPDGWHPDAEAIAVANGRIIFVGSNTGAEALRTSRTRVRDLGGATVIPGLVDSHTHVAELGGNLNRVDLRNIETEDDAIARLRAATGTVPPGEWVVGYGWDEGAWANRYPDMERLSAAFPHNPLVLKSLHGFAVWGNRMAFERANITARTPAPPGGEIRRDERGEPTGILLNRAGQLLTSAVPLPDPQQLLANTHAGLVAMAEAGYVGIHEAGADGRLMQAFEILERDDQLPIRVYAMLSARDTGLVRRWIDRGPDRDTEGMLRTRAVKAYYDGALGSRGARLLADYTDRPGHRGVSGTNYGFDQAIVAEAMGVGFQVAIHAIGDAGNRETLDFFERVFSEQPSTRQYRHRIEHAQVVHPADVRRFAPDNIIASMQPPHAVEDKAWAEQRLGPERILAAYAWRTFREAGARLIFNSDLPGSDHDVFYGLHAAITRRGKDLRPPLGWYPEQALTAEEAVRAYTSWPAYAAFAEAETGILAPGRWADITVLDADPFVLGTTAPERLLRGKILLTIVGGDIVYDRPN